MKATEIDIAYAAGIFDGEGCLYISPASKRQTHRLSVQVTNTHTGLLEWFKGRWGGAIYELVGNRRHGWAICWTWAINRLDEQADFLKAVQPHLKVKGDQAAIAIRFLEVRKPIGSHFTADAHARRHELFLELRGQKAGERISPPVVVGDYQLDIELEAS